MVRKLVFENLVDRAGKPVEITIQPGTPKVGRKLRSAHRAAVRGALRLRALLDTAK